MAGSTFGANLGRKFIPRCDGRGGDGRLGEEPACQGVVILCVAHPAEEIGPREAEMF